MILALETSTKACSVALLHEGNILGEHFLHSEQYAHSEYLHQLMSDLLAETGVKPKDLTAVAVGKGPGSYTGLRIGVAAAKGLAYTLNCPLLSASTTEILYRSFQNSEKHRPADHVLAMIDARRMEVYWQSFPSSEKAEIKASEISPEFFENFAGKILLVGDGAAKMEALELPERVELIEDIHPLASALAQIAESRLAAKLTENLVQFEPFYLKNFVAHPPRKLFD